MAAPWCKLSACLFLGTVRRHYDAGKSFREPAGRSLRSEMPRVVRCALIQATSTEAPQSPLEKIKQVMVDKHVAMIRQAAASGAQVVCLQEIFYGPYFCAEQSIRWYDFTEPVPDGPTTQLMRKLAAELRMAIILPVYEVESEGVYYNTAAVLGQDGSYLGKYRKTHIPQVAPGFWEK